MANFGKFMKDQLWPEDFMEWIIMFLMFAFVIGGIVFMSVMFSYSVV